MVYSNKITYFTSLKSTFFKKNGVPLRNAVIMYKG